MASEADAFKRYITSSLARTVACLDGLSAAEMGWKPGAASANSLRDLAVHSIANAEENVLGVAGGMVIDRSHGDEFSSDVAAEAIHVRLADVLSRIGRCLDAFTADELGAGRDHPRRGRRTGFESEGGRRSDVLHLPANHRRRPLRKGLQ